MPLVYDPVIKNGRWSVSIGFNQKTFSAVDSAEAKDKMCTHLNIDRRNVANHARVLQRMVVIEIAPTIRESQRGTWIDPKLRKTGRANYEVGIAGIAMGDVFKEPGSSGWMGYFEYPTGGSIMGFGWTSKEAALDLVNKIRKGEKS